MILMSTIPGRFPCRSSFGVFSFASPSLVQMQAEFRASSLVAYTIAHSPGEICELVATQRSCGSSKERLRKSDHGVRLLQWHEVLPGKKEENTFNDAERMNQCIVRLKPRPKNRGVLRSSLLFLGPPSVDQPYIRYIPSTTIT